MFLIIINWVEIGNWPIFFFKSNYLKNYFSIKILYLGYYKQSHRVIQFKNMKV